MGRREQAALRRIIALLLSLADLAQAACGRSAPIRWLVLLILGPGEAVARNYVAGLTGVPPSTQPAQMAIDLDADALDAKIGDARFIDARIMDARIRDARIMDDSVARAIRLATVFRAFAAALAAALATLPDEAAAPAPVAVAVDTLAALRDFLTILRVEPRDSS